MLGPRAPGPGTRPRMCACFILCQKSLGRSISSGSETGVMTSAGIRYCGWLPNYKVPEVFARSRVTLHIPRRPYVRELPGIPTIRPFEALACGVPLICSPWRDTEKLFTAGSDFLIAHNGDEMTQL